MLDNIIEVLASGLRIDEASVAWLARKMQDADLLPADSESNDLSPLHAARLLVALLAAARPIDAAATVAAYERTSMAAGSAVADASGNFVAALARLIESAATNPSAPMPAQIRARRSLGEPLGQLVDMPARPTGPDQGSTLVYGRCGDGDHAMGGASLEVYGTAPGAVLQALADLLRAVAGAERRESGAGDASPWPAQLRWLPATTARKTAAALRTIGGR